MSHARHRAAVLIAALVIAVLAGCADSPTHNDADVAFAQGMIPHHEQAVAMSGMVAGRGASPEVEALAGRIAQAQGPEIERMRAMLRSWGAQETGMHDHMAGMMSDAQMGELMTASGPAFDRAFLTMMIEHHQGAITMARTELDGGTDPAARELAGAIVTAQQAEIAEMQGLLARP